MRMTAEATETSDGIRLELAPLLSLYGKNRHLSLRVERLPDRARLSRGRNNGDRSWSLTREDLDDLHYLPPDGMKAAHTLAIRIINLDADDRATLAMLDLPVTPVVSSASKRNTAAALEPVDATKPTRPCEDCARTKTTLDARDRELTEVRHALEQAFEQSRAEGLKRENELAAARTAWQAGLERRLAGIYAESASKLETSRAAWQTQQNTRIEEARARWQREADAAFKRAKDAWKAEETVRLAQAEAQWREQAAHSLAAARAETARMQSALLRAEAEAARMSDDGAALRRLRGELAETNTSLGARVRELADARQALEQGRAEGLKGKAEFAAARASWQDELEKRLDEVRSAAAVRMADDVEGSLQNDMDRAREQWREESEAMLSRAKENWKSDEDARLARAEALWRERSARSLTDSAERLEKAEAALARAHAHALQESADAAELRRVREELSETRTILSDRETRLSQVRLDTKRVRERWKAEAEIALSRAQEAWKAEEAYRVSVARGDWQRDMRISFEDADAKEEQRPWKPRRLIFDGLVAAALAAALAVAVVVFYPGIAAMLGAYWPNAAPAATQSANAPEHLPPAHSLPAIVAPHFATITHVANVRVTPSATADVIGTLARGSNVVPLEKRGNWVRIHMGVAGAIKDGWVYGPYLRDPTGG
ncbi:MAG TPA: SH3 domain-containing protein [Rhizomicrobium sp.]